MKLHGILEIVSKALLKEAEYWHVLWNRGVVALKHEATHKLDVACLDCIKVHIEQKEKLLALVKIIAETRGVGWDIHAQKLLKELGL